jgi:hypothetical protein
MGRRPELLRSGLLHTRLLEGLSSLPDVGFTVCLEPAVAGGHGGTTFPLNLHVLLHCMGVLIGANEPQMPVLRGAVLTDSRLPHLLPNLPHRALGLLILRQAFLNLLRRI